MQIDPKSLKLVSEQDLINQGVEEHIAQVRVQHIHEKRIKRIAIIENTIRSGMLHQMKHAMDAVQSMKNPKSTMNANKPWNSVQHTYLGSDSQVDIPLREPLDTEYRLNRKLAKQIYNRERKQMVEERKKKLHEDYEETIEKYAKDQKKLEQKSEKIKKQKELEQSAIIEKKQNDRKDKLNNYKTIVKDFERNQFERLHELKEKDEEIKKKKEEMEAKKQLEMFKKEQELHRQQMKAQKEVMKFKAEKEKQFEELQSKIHQKLQKADKLKNDMSRERQQVKEQGNSKQLLEKDESFGFTSEKIQKLQKTFTKVQSIDKRLAQMQILTKATQSGVRTEKLAAVQQNKKELNEKTKEMKQNLQEKD